MSPKVPSSPKVPLRTRGGGRNVVSRGTLMGADHAPSPKSCSGKKRVVLKIKDSVRVGAFDPLGPYEKVPARCACLSHFRGVRELLPTGRAGADELPVMT